MATFAGSSTTVANDDQTWIAEDISKLARIGGTLDVSSFTAADHYPNGDTITSGICLGKITASGAYGPYDDTAMDGTETMVGILFEDRKIDPDDTTSDVDCAIVVAGVVDESKLPDAGAMTNGGIDSNGKSDNPAIRYI